MSNLDIKMGHSADNSLVCNRCETVRIKSLMIKFDDTFDWEREPIACESSPAYPDPVIVKQTFYNSIITHQYDSWYLVLCFRRWRWKETYIEKRFWLPFLTGISPNQISYQPFPSDVSNLDWTYPLEFSWLWLAGVPALGRYCYYCQISWIGSGGHKFN